MRIWSDLFLNLYPSMQPFIYNYTFQPVVKWLGLAHEDMIGQIGDFTPLEAWVFEHRLFCSFAYAGLFAYGVDNVVVIEDLHSRKQAFLNYHEQVRDSAAMP